MKDKFCIIIPCYKVDNHISNVIKKIDFTFVKHVIIVDDFCPNGSGLKAKKKFGNKKKYSYIFLKKNSGVGGATISGIKLAIKKKYRYIVKLDGDDQHDINTIKKFYRIFKTKKNINCCKGYRKVNFFKLQGMPFTRFIGNKCMTFIFRVISNKYYIKDVANGLIALDLNRIKNLNLGNLKKNFFFEQDLLFSLIELKANISQVKTKTIYADEKSNLKPLKVIIPFLLYYLEKLIKKLFS